jgi:hypothetical protein
MPRLSSPWLVAAAVLTAAPVQAADSAAASPDRPTARSIAPADAAADEMETAQAADQRRLIAEVRKEQAFERGLFDLPGVRRHAAFQDAGVITAPQGAGAILAFHPLAEGGIVIATGANERYGEQTLTGALASILGLASSSAKQPPTNRLLWLDASGAEIRSAPLPFPAKGVTIAPDGAVIAVGGDRVVVFSPAGEQVAESTAPHVDLSADELARLREEIAEQHREELAARREQLERLVASKAELEAVSEDDRTPRQKAELARATMMVKSYEAMLGRLEKTTGGAVDTGLAKARAIHRVAASRDHLFLVAHEPAGYGFGVWRCGRDFADPEKIIDGLSGCCGQMDVQVIGNELVIAENSRNRVAVYGLDGEPLRTFGEASRADIRKGFGGCCNPMNACAGPDGSLLLAESNGLVKQFAPDGTLTEILGVADVQSGCKNSSIGLSADGSRLYYLDIQKGRVLVMEKKS